MTFQFMVSSNNSEKKKCTFQKLKKYIFLVSSATYIYIYIYEHVCFLISNKFGEEACLESPTCSEEREAELRNLHRGDS